jgi:hypothetical protein
MLLLLLVLQLVIWLAVLWVGWVMFGVCKMGDG